MIATDIPARLDRLRWGRFHTLVVIALGITWILDGLEVTLAGAVAPALKESPRLNFSNASPEKIHEGIARLGCVLRDSLAIRTVRLPGRTSNGLVPVQATRL